MKCELCKAGVDTLFLEKVNGSYIKDAKGKKHLICPQCQKKFPKKDDILKKL